MSARGRERTWRGRTEHHDQDGRIAAAALRERVCVCVKKYGLLLLLLLLGEARRMAVGVFRMNATRARRVGGNAVCSSSNAARRSGVVTPARCNGPVKKRAAVVPAAKSGLDIDTEEIVNSVKEKVRE